MRIFLGVLLVILASCSNQARKSQQSDATQGEDICRYSKYLGIYKTNKGYQIVINHPEKKQLQYRFILTKPAEHLAVLSSTHIGMLSSINEERRIAAITDMRYVYSPMVKKRFKQKHIVELQNESSMSVDQLLSSNAEYVIYSAFSGSFSQEKRLKKLGISCIPNFDWREQTALGRAEWILLFGVLTGKVPEAIQLFKSIERAFHQAKEVKMNPAEMISGNVTGDFWYAPAGQSFVAEIYRNSGLNYIYNRTEGSGSLAYSLEKIMKDGAQVKIWLNPGFPSIKEMLKVNPKAKFMPFFHHSRIFCYTHNSNKFWELSTLRPDWLIEDLSQIASGKTTKNLHFYKEVK
jgi:iron complex transport system substrate-binding protein